METVTCRLSCFIWLDAACAFIPRTAAWLGGSSAKGRGSRGLNLISGLLGKMGWSPTKPQ